MFKQNDKPSATYEIAAAMLLGLMGILILEVSIRIVLLIWLLGCLPAAWLTYKQYKPPWSWLKAIALGFMVFCSFFTVLLLWERRFSGSAE